MLPNINLSIVSEVVALGSPLEMISCGSNGSMLNRGWHLRLPSNVKLFLFYI